MTESFLQKFLFRRISLLVILAFIINSIALLLTLHQGNGARSVVLHYNVVVGAELFGSTAQLLKIPLIGFFIFIVNLLLYGALKKRSFVLAESALWVSLIVSVLLLVSLLFLIRIN